MIKQVNGVYYDFHGFEYDYKTEENALKYINYVKENVHCDDPLESVIMTLGKDGKVEVSYKFHGKPFERIRRITGEEIAVCSQAV